MTFKAIIFDFDGVITDTEPVHMMAWLLVFRPLNISFGKEEYETHYVGLNDHDFLDAVSRIHKHTFSSEDKIKLINEKLKHTLNSLQKSIPLIPGVEDFVKRASKNHLFAICSGASIKEIKFVLNKLGWLEIFDPVVTQEDIKRGKPYPDGYNFTLKKLNERNPTDKITSVECLVIEDSPKGIAAAHAAGMKCLAISNSFSKEKLNDADWIVDSLAEIDPNSISL